ncbi:MAG: hypothetical protein HC788_00255 [Sphingopyxis sp.]|nr:hypothetical protein [Sphingopyxis sp.]
MAVSKYQQRQPPDYKTSIIAITLLDFCKICGETFYYLTGPPLRKNSHGKKLMPLLAHSVRRARKEKAVKRE